MAEGTAPHALAGSLICTMMTRKDSLIQSSVYCRAFTTGTHGEYLFLTLSNR